MVVLGWVWCGKNLELNDPTAAAAATSMSTIGSGKVARVAFMAWNGSARDRLLAYGRPRADAAHQVLQEVDVVDREQDAGEHLVGDGKMPQVGA